MIIVAGWLQVAPGDRESYLADCVAVVEQARAADGCLDFCLGADLVDPGRINVHERWIDEQALLAFRGSGPDDGQQVAIVDASVRRYEVASEGPAWRPGPLRRANPDSLWQTCPRRGVSPPSRRSRQYVRLRSRSGFVGRPGDGMAGETSGPFPTSGGKSFMDVSLTTWLVTCAVIAAFFVFDFYAHVRTPHAPTLKESGFWSAFYIGVAIIFGFIVMYVWGSPYTGEYFAGYVTEKALSVDNLFIFVIIMASFSVPREFQQKVLLIGIAMALVMRGIFIALGAAAINAYAWVFYLFGVFLIFTAVKLIRDHVSGAAESDKQDSAIIRLVKRVVPTTDEYHGDKLLTKVNGKRFITPMLLTLVAIGFTDLLFALDSIPAIYGLTQEPYLVFTANAFALLGLRQLFFLIGGLLERLVYLSYGLSIILAFIGVKLILHALHENTLPFINDGEHVSVPEVSTSTSLIVILGVLVVTTVASLIKTKGKATSADV